MRATGGLFVVTPADSTVIHIVPSSVWTRFSWRTTPWSPDGRRLVYTESAEAGVEPDQIWRVDADGSNATRLTSDAGTSHLPDWSPDGRSLVFNRWVDEVNTLDILVVDVATRETRPLISQPGWDHEPQWSPVSNRIAYLRTAPGGAYTLRSVATDGTDDRLVLGGHVQRFQWAPDGSALAVHWQEPGVGGGYRVAVVEASESRVTHLTPQLGPWEGWYLRGGWSPDGAWVAWGAEGRIVATRRDGSESREILDLSDRVHSVSWSPDGAWLSFVREELDGPNELWIVRSDGTDLRRIPVDGRLVLSAHWSPS